MEQQNVKLLRECDAGIAMGVSSISEVLDRVENEKMKNALNRCKTEHEKLKEKTKKMLDSYGDEGKSPNPVAKGMSFVKTEWMLGVDRNDSTVADLMTDGCNMGVKSLWHYLNRYTDADPRARSIAKELAESEEKLAIEMRGYL